MPPYETGFLQKKSMCISICRRKIIANIQVRGVSDLFYGEIKTELGLLAHSLVLSSTSQISAEELSSQSLCVLQETAAHIFLFYLFFLSSSEFVRIVIFKDF